MSSVLNQQLVNAMQVRIDLDRLMSEGQLRAAIKCQNWTHQDQECFQKVLDQGGRQNQITMRQFIFKYEQVLTTLKGQQVGQNNLNAANQLRIERFQNQIQNTSTFPMVFLTIVKVICNQPVANLNLNLYYKMEPSEHPGQTLLIRQNEVEVNRSYTLEVPDKTFSIHFFGQGNINIGEWNFQGNDNNSGVILTEDIRLQGLSVRVMVKYLNQVGQVEMDRLKEYNTSYQRKLLIIRQTLAKINNFRRVFFSQIVYQTKLPDLKVYTCLTNNVKNLYYLLLTQILVECLGCFCTPVCFLSLLVLFYLVLLIHEISDNDIKLKLGLCFLVLNCITVYTILALYLRVGINLRQVWWLYLGFSTGIVLKGIMLVVIYNYREFQGQVQQFMMNPA